MHARMSTGGHSRHDLAARGRSVTSDICTHVSIRIRDAVIPVAYPSAYPTHPPTCLPILLDTSPSTALTGSCQLRRSAQWTPRPIRDPSHLSPCGAHARYERCTRGKAWPGLLPGWSFCDNARRFGVAQTREGGMLSRWRGGVVVGARAHARTGR